MKDSRLPYFVNYSSFFKCRTDRAGGGLATLIRNDVNITPKNLAECPNGKLEVQAITVHCKNTVMDILNIYNPNQSISTEEFSFYFDQLDSNKLIVGDFNAHHPLWDTRHPENSTGSHLTQSLMQNSSLTVLTPVNLNTYFHTALRQFSTLDLCIINSHLIPSSSIQLGPDLGSDHSPIQIELSFSPILCPVKRRSRWIFNNSTQWQKFISLLPQYNSPPSNSLDNSYKSFSDNIIQTASICFKKTKESVTPKFSSPWWNDECNDAIRHRRHCKNLFHRHPTAENLTNLRRAEALAKLVTKKAKRKSLIDFASTLNRETPVTQIWSYLGKFARKHSPTPCYPILSGDQILTTPISKANAIGTHYSTIFNSANHDIDVNPLLITTALAMSDDSITPFNCPFLPHELDAVLDKLKTSAPGYDNIHNLMLKNLPINYRQWALQLLNESFMQSHIPSSWKQTLILPILKPNKSPLDASSYRPIALLPCFGKVAEKMICNRITYVLEKNMALSSTQGGFRKRLSTHEQIARLENSIRHSLYNKSHCIALFFRPKPCV